MLKKKEYSRKELKKVLKKLFSNLDYEQLIVGFPCEDDDRLIEMDDEDIVLMAGAKKEERRKPSGGPGFFRKNKANSVESEPQSVEADGFMNIPDAIDEHLSFGDSFYEEMVGAKLEAPMTIPDTEMSLDDALKGRNPRTWTLPCFLMICRCSTAPYME